MSMNWDLEIIYKGYDDPKYLADIEKVKLLIDKIKQRVVGIENQDPIIVIEEELRLEEELTVVLSDLFSYSSLRSSTNVNDIPALMEMGKLQLMLQETVEPSVIFQKFLKDIDLDKLA